LGGKAARVSLIAYRERSPWGTSGVELAAGAIPMKAENISTCFWKRGENAMD
jgi:hypothetical protein